MKEDIEPFFLKFIVYDWCCATVRPCFCAADFDLDPEKSQALHHLNNHSRSNGAGQHLVALMLEVRIFPISFGETWKSEYCDDMKLSFRCSGNGILQV